MAERRMFAKTIIDSDAFLDMPLSTQALYFHLSMRADDDGFVNSPKRIQRNIGASDDDLKVLIAKRFIIVFESGVIVIKHWKIHNYIQNDRYHKTVYQEEKALLTVKDNKAYTVTGCHGLSVYGMDTKCIHDGYNMDTEARKELDKNSIVYNNDHLNDDHEQKSDDHATKKSVVEAFAKEFDDVWSIYPNKKGKQGALKAFIKARRDGVSREDIENGVLRYRDYVRGTDIQYIKHGDTWFRGKCWEDDLTDGVPVSVDHDLDDIFT